MSANIIAFLLFVSMATLGYAFWGAPIPTSMLMDKLKQDSNKYQSVEKIAPLQSNPNSGNAKLIGSLSKIINMVKPKNMAAADRADLHRKILVSGNPFNITDITEYRGIQIVLAAILGFLGAFIALIFSFAPFWGVIGGIIVGAALPPFVTKQETSKRSALMKKLLPEALDLLTVSMCSGLNFQPSLEIVAKNMPDSPVQEELASVSRNMRSGMSTDAALKLMGEKFQSETLDAFIKAVILSKETGASIIKILENQSEFARQSYESDITQKVAKLESRIMMMVIPFEIPAFMAMFLVAPIYQMGVQGSF